MRIDSFTSERARLRVRDTGVLRELVMLRAYVISLEHDVMYGRRNGADLVVAEDSYRARYAQLVAPPAKKAVEPAPLPRLRRSSDQLIRGSSITRRPPKLTRL